MGAQAPDDLADDIDRVERHAHGEGRAEARGNVMMAMMVPGLVPVIMPVIVTMAGRGRMIVIVGVIVGHGRHLQRQGVVPDSARDGRTPPSGLPDARPGSLRALRLP
ncbi:hypothetical protein AA0498_2004 [Acidomonas methanolica]|nr:hypothetical protein AA0498_2004 [Acidomonas methanolica]